MDLTETSNVRAQINLKNYAVVVTKAFKNYGPVSVLQDLGMKVPKGAIYALLGSSGCGKTTLLDCLVGRKRLVSGHARVLGKKPGSEDLVSKIGYMPQNNGVYRGFTIRELLMFFGRVLGIQNAVIKERTEFYAALLMLPDTSYNVSELSDGQQRRVSLAIAFLNEPEILILDEPTVGIDPVLREIIWKHFLDITKTKNVTIIMTTHYIGETSQADIVGYMREGYLIAEDNPQTLMDRYEVNSLENLFLKLSIDQNVNKNKNIAANDWRNNYNFTIPSIKFDHLKALIWKHCLWLRKNFNQIIVAVILPVLLMSLFFAAIGHDPTDMKIAVVNDETEGKRDCNDTMSCDSNEISCGYLKYLENHNFVLSSYQTEEDAIKSVKQRETYASIVIKQNFSKALRARAYHWYRVDAIDLEQSTIDIFRDVSNKYISLLIQYYFHQSYQTFLDKYVEVCGLSRTGMSVPLQLKTLYHGRDPNFTDFCVPSALLSIVFVVVLQVTAFTIVLEKKEDNLDRAFVVGINKNEVMLSHALVQFVIITVQIVLLMIFTFAIFDVTNKGSLVLVAMMLILTGIAGICFGLFISCVCDTETGIIASAICMYFSILFTSGLIWPIEALHPWLKPFAVFFPLTKPTESLRYVMHRGWGLFYPDVYVGFLSLSAWSVGILLINIFFLKL